MVVVAWVNVSLSSSINSCEDPGGWGGGRCQEDVLGFRFRLQTGRCVELLPGLVDVGLAFADVKLRWLVIDSVGRPSRVLLVVISIRNEMLPEGASIDSRPVFVCRVIVALCCIQRGGRFTRTLEQSSIVAFAGYSSGLALVVL